MKTILLLVLFSIAIITTGCASLTRNLSPKPMIIAHRGSSQAAPENTVAAAMLAWRQDADAVEVDIHLSKDNRIMVIHDKTTKRTAGVDMTVSETNSADLRKLDVGSHKDKKYGGEKIPFLEEIIETLPPNKKLFIELKSDAKTLPHLKKIVEESRKADQLIIIGFDLKNMAEMKRITPYIPIYWLKSAKKDEATEKYIPYDPNIIAITRQNGLDALNLFHHGITKSFTRHAKKQNLPLYTWTVDDPQAARQMKKLQIEGITTNVPDAMKRTLR